MTCEVGLSRSVRAFHIMPGLPGPEGQLHDHDYRIEIVVDREQLDDRGMVCDLDVLEAALTELTSRVEDRNLEEIRPAGFEAVTVEVFARWVHDSLSPAVAAAGGGLAEPDDLRLLEKGAFVYDALYAWCRTLQNETHAFVSYLLQSPNGSLSELCFSTHMA